jgi:hypothetical protein
VANAEVRTVHWGIRLMLLVGTAFVTFDFVQLTFLAERTDRYFSWTIDAPITAVVLGSFYFAAIILTLLGGTQRAWVRTRAVVPGTWAFVTLVLLATLIHLDVFRPHMESPNAITRFEFWVWIGAYTVEPIGLLVFGILQRRRSTSGRGPRPARSPPSSVLRCSCSPARRSICGRGRSRRSRLGSSGRGSSARGSSWWSRCGSGTAGGCSSRRSPSLRWARCS